MYSRTILFVMVTTSLLAVPALAADNGFYVGGSFGYSSFDATDLDAALEGEATGYKVFAGGRFLQFVGIELSYVDFGDLDGGTVAGNSLEVTGGSLEAIGYLPLGIADFFVKGGVFQRSEIVVSGNGPGVVVSGDDTSPVWGAGIQFRIRSFAVRGEVEYFDVDGIDELYMVSVGGSYTF